MSVCLFVWWCVCVYLTLFFSVCMCARLRTMCFFWVCVSLSYRWGQHMNMKELETIKPWQKINHFPGNNKIIMKKIKKQKTQDRFKCNREHMDVDVDVTSCHVI